MSSDEGDHEAGANVGRALTPSPANCDGVTTPCTYAPGTFGELEGNVTGLLNQETGDIPVFDVSAQIGQAHHLITEASALAGELS